MRFAKDSMVVSRERDIPLLRQVRNSKFVTHNQLFQFMRLGGFDHDRDSFNWRVRRLKSFGHIAACPDVYGADSAVYRITERGVVLLEHYGQFAVILNSRTGHLLVLAQVFHALELNSIQLALTRNNLVASWQSEFEVASFNTISRSPYRKDYDAIVDVWLGEKRARFALEYERSLKNIKRYSRIRQALETETGLACILYLTSGIELLVPLIQALGPSKQTLVFADSATFQRDLIHTQVFVGEASAAVPFREILSASVL
jgi:hypothetical protein